MGLPAAPLHSLPEHRSLPWHSSAKASAEAFVDGGAATWRALAAVEQSPSPPPMSSCGRYILHRVCRFDTLAGVAIKYGVEVADVKRVNGLATDLQMFAHKTLRIPLHGRHPPSSPRLPNAASSATTDQTRERTTRRPPKDAWDSFLKPQRNCVSPAMGLLQGYYGLTQPQKGEPAHEGTEMAVYITRNTACLQEELPWLKGPLNSEPLSGQHRKTRSLMSGSSLVNGDANDESGDNERPIRRRQKADAELLPREENGGILARAAKGLTLRPKWGNPPDLNKTQQNFIAMGMPSFGDGLQFFRKSSSTPEFQDSDSNSLSIWPTSKWSLKPDAFALPLPLPLFDSIPKPIAAWRNKAARD